MIRAPNGGRYSFSGCHRKQGPDSLPPMTRSGLFHRPLLVVLLIAFAGLMLTASVVSAAPEDTRVKVLRANVERLKQELKVAEEALGNADKKTTPMAPAPVSAPSAGKGPAIPPAESVASASNRFLDYLIVLSFLALALSFIGARYRDSQATTDKNPDSKASGNVPPATSGAVVFYARESAPAPIVAALAEAPVIDPEDSVNNGGEVSDGLDAAVESEDGGNPPESSEADSGESSPPSQTEELRVEPKRKSRPRSRNT